MQRWADNDGMGLRKWWRNCRLGLHIPLYIVVEERAFDRLRLSFTVDKAANMEQIGHIGMQ